MLLYMARQLYLSDEGHTDIAVRLDLLRNFKKNYDNSGNADDMVALKKDLTQYMHDLRSAGVKDWELQSLDTSTCNNIGRLIYSLLYVFSGLTLVDSVKKAVPGFIYLAPLRIFLMRYAEQKRIEALKKSTVKIKGNDVVASWKLLIGVFLIPFVIFLTAVLFFFTYSQRLASGFAGRYFVSCIFYWILFGYLTFSVQMLNGVKTNSRICIIRFFVVLYRKTIARLTAKRKELKRSVKDTMDKYSKMHDQTLYKRKSFTDSHHSPWHINTEEVFGALSEIYS